MQIRPSQGWLVVAATYQGGGGKRGSEVANKLEKAGWLYGAGSQTRVNGRRTVLRCDTGDNSELEGALQPPTRRSVRSSFDGVGWLFELVTACLKAIIALLGFRREEAQVC